MCPLADHFHLPLGNDKELITVLTLDNQFVSQRDHFGLESAGHPRGDVIRQAGKQGDPTQVFRGERSRPVHNANLDPLGLHQLDLRPIHSVGSTAHLNPGKQP